jgi:hypothetical protein
MLETGYLNGHGSGGLDKHRPSHGSLVSRRTWVLFQFARCEVAELYAWLGPPAATVRKNTLRTGFLGNSGRLSGDFGTKAAR